MNAFMQKLGVLAATLSAFLSASAYDFEVDGIYYNITAPTAKKVEVTFKEDGSVGSYSGDIVVPPSVSYDGDLYSVTSIGREAFSDCSSLTSITIPNSVTSIGDWAFSYCRSLTSIDVDVDNETFSSDDGILYDKLQTTLICCPGGKSEEVIIPNSVTAIGNEAFINCSSLTAINIPNSVTYIGYAAFVNCSSLTSINIPNSVTSIRGEAFSYCSSLISIDVDVDNEAYLSNDGILYDKLQTTLICCPGGKSEEVIIPSTVTTIGDHAFSCCSSLTSITIPNSVTSIGSYAFSYCSSLTSITLPNSVTSIGGHAFSCCSSLTSITIPNSVTAIGVSAFHGCSSLTSITIPNSVTSIGFDAFSDCSSLTSITIPNSVTSIGDGAFSGCSSLTSITIPNSVTSIVQSAFSYCSSLTSIDVDVDNKAYSSNDGILYDKSQTTLICCPEGKSEEVIIPNSVTSIGNRAFYYCSSLTSINIPNSVTSIGDGAFDSCWSLTSITIPNSVTSIGEYAFYGCSSLPSITIPNSVTSIEIMAFYECRSLASITSLAVTPPECGSYVFNEVDKLKCTLYVPAESVEAYKQAPGWKDFVLVEAVAGEAAGIDSVAAGTADGATEVFNLTGAKVADSLENLPAGIYLVRKGLTIRKIAVR